MYRDRGGGGSRPEMGQVDRKRINDALDKHLERSSPSTSRALNGKEKDRFSAQSTLSGGKPPPDLAETKGSDGSFKSLSMCFF
ncbi:hypothetical protein RHMOL_Rhmol11G0008000 [Rhododendron molle]|uniref:Uncharacterized protein n=1 Tax=Rhododendron molle TaxID=49168 RepID=A0ACC0LMF0_RHOML|nr:hypothetical protein RHMOL_Rhmol11G0008000 [Rhododendron molle]